MVHWLLRIHVLHDEIYTYTEATVLLALAHSHCYGTMHGMTAISSRRMHQSFQQHIGNAFNRSDYILFASSPRSSYMYVTYY